MGQENVQETMPVNRKAKDTFFKTVYASEERRRKLASFLLGIEGKQITTANVRPVLFGNKENDLAFVCDAIFYVMTESQATICPNISYRLLEYITAGLRSTVDSEQLLYSRKRVCFPIPKLYLLQTGLEMKSEHLPEKVQYDVCLSDSYLSLNEKYEKETTKPDLEVVVHVYDFRMTFDDMLCYIEKDVIPARFEAYDGDMRDYALTANGITYMQRAVKEVEQQEYLLPHNVSSVAQYLELLIERGIFVDLLNDKEVCNMTMAQFSRDDILIYQGKEEGEIIGEIKGAIRTYKKLGVMFDDAKHYIMDEFQKSEEETGELMSKYWK